jgi:hypothetical protein
MSQARWLTSVIPATQDTETRRITVQDLSKQLIRPYLTNKLEVMVCACDSSYMGLGGRRPVLAPGKTLPEKQKKAGGLAQVIQHLPSKHTVLSSNPSTTKKQK